MILTSWPSEIRSGDTLQLKLKVDGYDSSVDIFQTYISNATENNNFTASDSDGEFFFDVASSITRNWAPGDYYLVGVMTTAGGVETTVVDYQIKILPNLRVGSSDPRTHAKKMLDAIEAVLEKRATSDVLEYEIEGRRLVKMPIADLLRFRSFYERLCFTETSGPTKVRRFFK